jgi:hypothetical protein
MEPETAHGLQQDTSYFDLPRHIQRSLEAGGVAGDVFAIAQGVHDSCVSVNVRFILQKPYVKWSPRLFVTRLNQAKYFRDLPRKVDPLDFPEEPYPEPEVASADSSRN